MIKKIIVALLLILPNTVLVTNTYATEAPSVNCIWLPWCVDTDKTNPTAPNLENKNSLKWIANIVWELIKYVAVIAVLSVMISWVMYMISWGEEEKVKKAKNWIIWSLIWVLLSISAWWIISMLNAIKITL